MGLSRFSDWICPGSRTTRRARDAPASSVAMAMAGALFPDSPSGFREPAARRARKETNRRRRGREEAMVDREHDMVIVPLDGGDGYLSDSGSDDSESPTGPSAGSSRRGRSSTATGIPTAASPSSCRVTATAAAASRSLVAVGLPTAMSPVARIL